MVEPALLFRDGLYGDDEKGVVELAVFSGPDAYQRAIRYADRQYRAFDEIDWPRCETQALGRKRKGTTS
jgi:hypothetical protein